MGSRARKESLLVFTQLSDWNGHLETMFSEHMPPMVRQLWSGNLKGLGFRSGRLMEADLKPWQNSAPGQDQMDIQPSFREVIGVDEAALMDALKSGEFSGRLEPNRLLGMKALRAIAASWLGSARVDKAGNGADTRMQDTFRVAKEAMARHHDDGAAEPAKGVHWRSEASGAGGHSGLWGGTAGHSASERQTAEESVASARADSRA
ncbi:MAG: hypothetical protein OSB57_12455, partial [Planctomycetota bacterium]|nr:hypothetical protein [Planctomycetota bacterium]